MRMTGVMLITGTVSQTLNFLKASKAEKSDNVETKNMFLYI